MQQTRRRRRREPVRCVITGGDSTRPTSCKINSRCDRSVELLARVNEPAPRRPRFSRGARWPTRAAILLADISGRLIRRGSRDSRNIKLPLAVPNTRPRLTRR